MRLLAIMKRNILIYGLCGGVLIVLLRLIEYRFLIVQHSLEIYGGLIAAIFAVLGIWLGLRLTRKEQIVVVKEVTAPTDAFEKNQQQLARLGNYEKRIRNS